MLKIREVKTSSGKRAIQVILYKDYKRIVLKHVGSASNPLEISSLRTLAEEFIKDYSRQISIFPEYNPKAFLYVDYAECIGYYYRFFYDVIVNLMEQVGLGSLSTKLFRDLVVIRIFEPASKLGSIELLEDYFGIVHRRQGYYKKAKKWLQLKDKVQDIVLSFAQQEYGFDHTLLFYGVTTLYFETFESDELRTLGFPKIANHSNPKF